MTGVDCIWLEEHIEQFVSFFVRPGQTLSDPSCMELRHLVDLFQLVRKITTEMRAEETTCREDRPVSDEHRETPVVDDEVLPCRMFVKGALSACTS